MTVEPDWAKVLRVLYEEGGELNRKVEGGLTEDHVLVVESGLEKEDVDVGLAFLRDQELIDPSWAGQEEDESGETRATHIQYTLTEKGFDVAHRRELVQQQDKTNRMLTIVTVGLFVAALIQALASFYSVDPSNRWEMALGTIILMAALIYSTHWTQQSDFL